MSTTSISTTVYSKSYLAKAWQTRHDLTDYERRGFGQFFYLTLCAHLEAVIAKTLHLRCRSLQRFKWEAIPPWNFTTGGTTYKCDAKPLTDTIARLVNEFDSNVKSASWTQLEKSYSVFFSKSIREVIGTELFDDLLALVNLRNIFAHGRDYGLDFDYDISDLNKPAPAQLDGNKIKPAAVRLYKAQILKNLRITSHNYDELYSIFYSDEALIYFYDATKWIEIRLFKGVDFLIERETWFLPFLPALE